MKTYREIVQNLSPYQGKNLFRIYIYIGLGYLMLGFTYYFIIDNSDTGVLWFLSGIGFIIAAFRQKSNAKKYFIEFNDNCIEAKVELFAAIKINWTEIETITIKPISIEFLLKDKSVEELSLAALSYKSVITIKEKLNEFAEKKSIPII